MNRFLTFPRLSLIFLSLFAVAVSGVLVLQRVWVDPGVRCEAQGRWWDMESRICAQPVSIAEITGRPNGQSREAASREKNRELVAIEHALRDQRRARDAEIAAERARLRD